ncbi:MAG: phnB [Herbinix sp.]|jgi:PhnB protein|nr:phnB [Herbinix sp.]
MISPAFHFTGNCNEAINFYEEVFDAIDKQVEYYRDAPSKPGFLITDDMKDLVMHGTMTICGTPVNFSDTLEKTSVGNMICLNVFCQSSDEVCRIYHKLKEDGQVIVELGPQFFSSMYGSVIDRYGIKWQLIS